MRIIAGKWRGRVLKAPFGTETRPTSSMLRETVFNMLQQDIEGSDFLDLFAGSGAIGIEAMSRGARQATFIDASEEAIKAIRTNLKSLDCEAMVLKGDVFKMLAALEKKGAKFDLIFADAPYTDPKSSDALLEALGNVNLLRAGGRLLIEDANSAAPSHSRFGLISTRKSGKSFLHDFRLLF